MKDGKKFEILQKTVSDNAAFAAKYAPGATDNRTSVLAFAADLCRQLDERGVRHVVSHSVLPPEPFCIHLLPCPLP